MIMPGDGLDGVRGVRRLRIPPRFRESSVDEAAGGAFAES